MSGEGPTGNDSGHGTDAGEPTDVEEPADMGDPYDDIRELQETVDDSEERRRVQAAMRTAMQVRQPTVFGRVVKGFGREDLAEAFLGAVLFGIPMFVEGGTQEVAEFVSTRPVYLLGTLAVGVGTVIGILYLADIHIKQYTACAYNTREVAI